MNIELHRASAARGFTARVFALCVLTAALGPSPAFAGAAPQNAGKEPITVTLSMKKIVTDAKGKETLQDAASIKPGDVVEYTAAYRNVSEKEVAGLKASLPVPEGLEYVKQSASPATAMATADGVRYGAEPLQRREKDASGQERTVDIAYSDYRGLRWEVGALPAGKSIAVKARMRVAALPK